MQRWTSGIFDNAYCTSQFSTTQQRRRINVVPSPRHQPPWHVCLLVLSCRNYWNHPERTASEGRSRCYADSASVYFVWPAQAKEAGRAASSVTRSGSAGHAWAAARPAPPCGWSLPPTGGAANKGRRAASSVTRSGSAAVHAWAVAEAGPAKASRLSDEKPLAPSQTLIDHAVRAAACAQWL